MGFVTGASTMAIVVAAVTVLPKLIGRITKSAKAKINENGEKSIDVTNLLYWMLYGGASLSPIVGIGVYLFTDEPLAGIGFIILGLVFILPTAILQFADTSVDWTNEYISGARTGASLKKNRILWSDVESATFHPNLSIEITDRFGKSVFLSVFQSGWYEFIEDLRHIRPDIEADDFE